MYDTYDGDGDACDDDDNVYVTTCPSYYTPMAYTARRPSSKLTVIQYYRTAQKGCTDETATANTNMKQFTMLQYCREDARHHKRNERTIRNTI